MGAPAKRAQFDRGSQRRRSMLAKIHVAKKQLALDDDDYRQILLEKTQHLSSADCSEAELKLVLGRLEAIGFRALPKAGASKPGAQYPMARKARALWISLYHLGAVHNPAEEALQAFACKQLKCERFEWARQSDGYKLIEALKDMAKRAGWQQRDMAGKPLPVLTLQSHLCDVILAKLKAADAVPADWELHHAMWRLCGIENGRDRAWSSEDYARLAKALGDKLRAAIGGAR